MVGVKANTPVVPVGIAGTEAAMPTGSKFPSRVPVTIVVGEVMDPPKGADGKRAKRSDLKLWTEELKSRLQECQSRARNVERLMRLYWIASPSGRLATAQLQVGVP